MSFQSSYLQKVYEQVEKRDGTEKESFFNPVGCDCRQWIRAIKAAGCPGSFH